ncbi:hypothetical protein RFI_39110, partial [Reticulomyxa filosa]
MRDFEQYQVEYLEITVKTLKEIMNSLSVYFRKKERDRTNTSTHHPKHSNTTSNGSMDGGVAPESYWSPPAMTVLTSADHGSNRDMRNHDRKLSGDEDNDGTIPPYKRLLQTQNVGSSHQLMPLSNDHNGQTSGSIPAASVNSTHGQSGLGVGNPSTTPGQPTRHAKKISGLFSSQEDTKGPSLQEMWPHIRQLIEGYILLWYCHPDEQ